MPARAVKIIDEKGEEITAFARLKGVVADKWEMGAIPPAAAAFDRYLAALPFAFGRVPRADEATGVAGDEASWFTIDSQTCSRLHAVLRFDEASQQFMLKALGLNGVDVDRACPPPFPLPAPRAHTCAHARALALPPP